jgi:hypothetical protein
MKKKSWEVDLNTPFPGSEPSASSLISFVTKALSFVYLFPLSRTPLLFMQFELE